jgi:hypothetical protein
MAYLLVVTRREPNPKYDERNRGTYSAQPEVLETEVLRVELTDDEYRAAKQAVLAVTEPVETVMAGPPCAP